MPSVTYMNQSAPFWDWVASLEQQGAAHPWFSQNQNEHAGSAAEGHRGPPPPPFGGWGWGFPGFGGRGFPHRGPPPPGPPPHDDEPGEKDNEKDKEGEDDRDNGEGPSGSGSDGEGRCGGRRGRCGGRCGRHGCGSHGRGGFGGWGGHGHPHHHGHGRRGGGGPPWARGGPFRGGPGFNPLAFAASMFEPASGANKDEDFTPEADIFDTSSAFVVHVSLPGAKKEDVGVNWDAEKSELSIAGVVYRPGDEDFLKTLAMDERRVGPFERKIRLGTRVSPAQIDADGISAKLEDGVLRVEVPKLSDAGFVEVRKVDIQ